MNTWGESSGCGTPCVTLRSSTACGSDAGISQHGLKEHGGWSDTQVPNQIYADQEAESAREEAKQIRAQIRGESAPAGSGAGYSAPLRRSRRTPQLSRNPKPGTRNPEPNKPRRFRVIRKSLRCRQMTNGPG